MAKKTETLNVRIPDEIAKWIDSLVDKKLFSSRSEVVRHFIREYVNDQKSKNLSSSNISHTSNNSKISEGEK